MNVKTTIRARLDPILLGGLVALAGLGLAPSTAAHAGTACLPLSYPGGSTQLCPPDTGSTSGGLNEGLNDVFPPMVMSVPGSGATGMPTITPGWKIPSSATGGTSTGTGSATSTSTVSCTLDQGATGGWGVSCASAVGPGSTVVSVVKI